MCPLDIFKHRKNKSNLLKDCIHHHLPITETKLISQEDTSGTLTRQTNDDEAQARALFEASLQINRRYGYIEAGLELSSDSVVKRCPPFLISKHSAATSTFLTALTWTFDYHIRFFFFQIHSKIEFLQTLIYAERISSSPSTQQERGKPLFQGDSNESRNKLGPGDSPTVRDKVSPMISPGNLAPAARTRHRITEDKDAQGGTRSSTQSPLFHNVFGMRDKKQQRLRPAQERGYPNSVEGYLWKAAITWTQTEEELGSSRVQNDRDTQREKIKQL